MNNPGNKDSVYLNALGVINALGDDKDSVRANLLLGKSPGMGMHPSHLHGKSFFVGAVKGTLPAVPKILTDYSCRNSQLSLAALEQIQVQIDRAKAAFGADRIGVVMGTSTSGVDEMEKTLWNYEKHGTEPQKASFLCQEIGSTADFVARAAGITGPAYSLSSACSSSGKALVSARGLIHTKLCDAVLVGGTDSLCELTLNGFASLEAISDVRTNPFSRFRRGINVGEGSAIFLMSREPVGPKLGGFGDSSDAFHMASPDPSGAGASSAMRAALEDAQLQPGQIQYINLHGTGTAANDLMESRAVHEVFGADILCSSTKPLTGHTLGASGATEAALCWLLLSGENRHVVAPHISDGESDPELGAIRLCSSSTSPIEIKHILSNSFAFGGNNVSVILSRNDHG